MRGGLGGNKEFEGAATTAAFVKVFGIEAWQAVLTDVDGKVFVKSARPSGPIRRGPMDWRGPMEGPADLAD